MASQKFQDYRVVHDELEYYLMLAKRHNLGNRITGVTMAIEALDRLYKDNREVE